MITSINIDQLTPDFLIESRLFKVAILDVQGVLLKANHSFYEESKIQEGHSFLSVLGEKSRTDFSTFLDVVIQTPKSSHLAEFEMSSGDTYNWEFTVATNKEMDILGLIGVGIRKDYTLDPGSNKNLLDSIVQAKISLDAQFKVKDGDAPQLKALGIDLDRLIGKNLKSLMLDQRLFKNLESEEFITPTNTVLNLGDKMFKVLLIKDGERTHAFVLRKTTQVLDYGEKVLTDAQIAAIPLPIWVLNESGCVMQQNLKAKDLYRETFSEESELGERPECFGREFFDRFESYTKGGIAHFRLDLGRNNLDFLSLSLGSIINTDTGKLFVLVQAVKPPTREMLNDLQKENERLKEIALKPSYILRSPLSSMLGLLDLIDEDQLDVENKMYFSHLKPLATELDSVIRKNAKKASAFD